MRTLLACAIIILTVARAAAFAEDIVPGKWEMLADQTSSVREASARAGWKKVSPPLRFRLPYEVKWDYQYIWLRSSFDIKGDPARYFGITLGNVYLVHSVYINGRMVGELSPAECRIVHNPVHYIIPPGTLLKGRNEIHIRLGTYDTEPACAIGDVAIKDRERYLISVTLTDILYLSYPLGIIIFIVTLCMFTIIMFFWDRSELIFLHSAAFCLIHAATLAFFFSPQIPLPHALRIQVNYGVYPLMAIVTIFIAQSMTGKYYQAINRTVIPLLAAMLCVVWCLRFMHVLPAVPRYINLAVIPFFVTAILYIIFTTYRLKREKFVLVIFSICVVVPIITGSAEVLNMMLLGSLPPNIFFMVSPLLLAGVVIFNVRKIMMRKVRLIVLYRDFQRSQKQSDRKSVTPATEGKIAEVIRFLEDNYREDISREGLAAAVDLSPDHLSRMFKASTGKKISDFINELRIREAVRLIAATEDRITDIAAGVGFESLTTFNRNFIKVMGVPPADYRKQEMCLQNEY